MSEDSKTSYSCGCGSCVITLFVFWALFFGVATTWGVLHIDLFPPGVYVETNE